MIEGSPFLIDNIDEAYAAYCAMPHTKRQGYKKPTKATFKKLYAERRLELNADAVREAKGETLADLAQQIAELSAAVASLSGEDTTQAEFDTPRPRPIDAARNGVLWRLNVEGLLTEALDASEGDYIQQAAGVATLEAHFGPLDA